MKRAGVVGLVILLAVTLSTCKSGGFREDPILRLSAAEAFAEGKRLYDLEKYSQARNYLQHAFDVEPNSATGREALLMVADAYFLQGGVDNYVKSEAKYRDFLNRFPTSQRADYAMFQIAASLAERIRKPDRERKATDQALTAYEELIRLYPSSEYAEEARTQIGIVRDHLAEHEFQVGYFYLRYRLPPAAIARFESLLEDYPDYAQRDKVLHYLAIAYERAERGEDAEQTRDRLRREHPESSFLNKKL